MSAEPVWCFFRVHPDAFSSLQQAFEEEIGRSTISDKLQKYIQRRERQARLAKKQLEDFPFFGDPEAFELIEYADDAQLFIDANYDVFFPAASEELFVQLNRYRKDEPDSMIEMVMTHRVSPTQMLYGALGWQLINRLPGLLGNMFISPQDVSETLKLVNEIFIELDFDELTERACLIGGSGVGNDAEVDRLMLSLPSALKSVLQDSYGLAAISYPYVGVLPLGAVSFEEEY